MQLSLSVFAGARRVAILVLTLWPVAGLAEDPVPFDTERRKDPFLEAEDAARTFSLPDGFAVTVFAAEPHVRQPIGMTFDGRGRLWVAENYTYAERALNFETRLDDRILIFEDRDGDGRFDERKVFHDRIKHLTSVELGFGGVWATCAPELLFIPDRDGDDVPDGEPEVVLDGWDNGRVRHNIVNGLRWGPDGWLYGRHGIQNTSFVGRPGTPREARTPINCGIWRLHPVRRDFEVVAHGTTNSWGHDWDDHGQFFFINTVIGHLWHVIPGAHYKRMYGADFNPHVYELMPQTADHYHWDRREAWNDIRKGLSDASSRLGGGHAHSGMAIYLGGSFPARYRNGVFTVNYHGRRVNHDRLARSGATYVGTHEKDLLTVGDVWFRGVELVTGPDGSLYVSDWSDVGECHDSDGVHRSSGRIYRISHGESKKPGGPLGSLDNPALVALQSSSNDWWVRQARRVLHERSVRGDDMTSTHVALRALFDGSSDDRRRLRALWALDVTAGADSEWLLARLSDPSEHVRVHAVKRLAELEPLPAAAAARFEALARSDPSGLVAIFVASALQRMPPASRWSIASALAGRRELRDDRFFPLMVWYGVEPAVTEDPERAVALARSSALPDLTRFVARRLGVELESRPAGAAALIESLRGAPASYRRAALEGLSRALEGFARATPPPGWTKLVEEVAASDERELRRLVAGLGVLFGDGRALDDLARMARRKRAPVNARRRAIESLVQARAPGTEKLLLDLLRERDVAEVAARGLARFDGQGVPRRLLASMSGMRSKARLAVIDTLSSRPDFAPALLEAIEQGNVPRSEVAAFQVRRMRSFERPAIDARLDALWPGLRRLDGEARERLEAYRERLSHERLARADLDRGRALWSRACSPCHRLHGDGGDAGPDLTGSDRKNLDYLLSNILDPSGEVAESYRVSILRMKDGRVLNGVVINPTARSLELRTPEALVTIDRREVLSIAQTEMSLMPEGLLEPLSNDEVRDLMAFLGHSAPAPTQEKTE